MTEMIVRPKFKEVTLDNVPPEYDLVEPKMDGMWAEVRTTHIQEGTKIEIWSRHGGLKHKTCLVGVHIPDGVWLAEFMFGSNWAFKRNKVGELYLFDVVELDGEDLTGLSLSMRKIILRDQFTQCWIKCDWVKLVPWYAIDGDVSAEDIWDWYVAGDEGYEGLVFKSSQGQFGEVWARCKKVLTVDYICMGMAEDGGRNAGRLGAILGGLIEDGKVRQACRVGGGFSDEQREGLWQDQDKFIGKVFEARGYTLFDSGALRHPQFVSWREDKLPEECVK